MTSFSASSGQMPPATTSSANIARHRRHDWADNGGEPLFSLRKFRGFGHLDAPDLAAVADRSLEFYKRRNDAALDPDVHVGRLLSDERRHQSDKAAELYLHYVMDCLVPNDSARERFFASRRDHQLHESRLRRHRHLGDHGLRGSRVQLPQQREQQPVRNVFGKFHPLVYVLRFAVAVDVMDLDLSCRGIDPGFHRLLEGRALLDEMVRPNPEPAALRKSCFFLVKRAVLEMKYQLTVDEIAFRVLVDLAVSEPLAVGRSKSEEPVHQTLAVANRDQLRQRRLHRKRREGQTDRQKR